MPQYQHFIPQFILRKHSDYKEPRREDFAPGLSKEYQKAKEKAKKNAKVNVLSLENGLDNMKLEVRKTKGVCGLKDMYGTEIEKKFDVLENKASKIIRGIELDFASGSKMTCLSRSDKDTLRRFLFIMLYRSHKFHVRFKMTTDDYFANDKSALMDYMHERGFATPRDVWLDNLQVFLDVKLGHDCERWEAELLARAYTADAEWFIHHMNNFYLCFCTPEDCRDEFILTQNVYGIFEGPNSYESWTDWHNFSPISPKLLIVLRNIYLQPSRSDPRFDRFNDYFEKIVEVSCSMYPDPAAARSLLADIPVERPRPSYSTVRLVRNAKAPILKGRTSAKDTFDFKLFTLSSKHVQLINAIFLENAPGNMTIVFGERTALRRGLEFYLELERPGFKTAGIINTSDFYEGPSDGFPVYHDLQTYLTGLEKVVRSLGSGVRTKYNEPIKAIVVAPFSPKFEQRYRKLGWDGLPATWYKDIDQAFRITLLHVCTETFIKFRGRKIKDQLRTNRRNIFDALHPRRIWLHLRMRGVMRHHENNPSVPIEQIVQEVIGNTCCGPEDTIVDASSIFNFSSLSKLMMTASDMNNYLNVYKMDGEEAPFWFHAERAYSQIGSILCCGSSLLQERAAKIYSFHALHPSVQVLITKQSAKLSISRELMTDLIVRLHLDEQFEDFLGQVLSADMRTGLRHIIMDIVYPTHMSSKQLSSAEA